MSSHNVQGAWRASQRLLRLAAPIGQRRKREDDRLLGLIRHHLLASGGVYGYRKGTVHLLAPGEASSRHRVLWVLQSVGLRAEVGYGSNPRYRGGPVGAVANVLNRDFAPDAPNKAWVTNIT
jgi:putative transposase